MSRIGARRTREHIKIRRDLVRQDFDLGVVDPLRLPPPAQPDGDHAGRTVTPVSLRACCPEPINRRALEFRARLQHRRRKLRLVGRIRKMLRLQAQRRPRRINLAAFAL